MKSNSQRVFFSLWVVAALATSVTAGNWAVDFDSPLPANWGTSGITEPPGGTSATFSTTIESGVLRLSDVTPASNGGSFGAWAGTSDVFTEVLVGASVNVAMDSNDDLGVMARSNPLVGNGYFGNVDFEQGQACIAKLAAFSTGVDMACTAVGSLSTSASYYIELSATGAATTDLKLDVFDMTGGTLLQTVNASDDGTIPNFGPAYIAGTSGLYMVPLGTTLDDAKTESIDGTFDNVFSAVPEPTAGSLLLLAVLGLVHLRRRA